MASSSRIAPVLPLSNGSHSYGGRTPSLLTPSSSRPQNAEPLRTSGIARRMSSRGVALGSENFYSDADFEKHAPKGLASMAAHQVHYDNSSSFRKFGWLSHRLRNDDMMKLGDLSDRLFGLEVDLLENPPSNDEASLPITTSDGTSLPGSKEGDTRYQQREVLLAQCKKLWKEYSQSLLIEKEMQCLPKVSLQAHAEHYRLARDAHGLSEEQLEVLRYMDDFITVTPDTTFQKFEFLLYSKHPKVEKFLRFLSRLFCQAPSAPAPDGFHAEHNARVFKWTLKCLLGLSCCALFLTPVGILYLGGLEPGASFAVAAAFSVVFVAIMVVFEERFGRMLFGICAYMAVMVVFLSNQNVLR